MPTGDKNKDVTADGNTTDGPTTGKNIEETGTDNGTDGAGSDKDTEETDTNKNKNQARMGPYSRTSAALWAALGEEERAKYLDLAKELSEGTATDEEKRMYVHCPATSRYHVGLLTDLTAGRTASLVMRQQIGSGKCTTLWVWLQWLWQ